jgi:hypothetical protein
MVIPPLPCAIVTSMATEMATFVKREARGKVVWLVRVRRKGHSTLARTFERLVDGKAWAARMEAAVSEERAVPGSLARRHTLTEPCYPICFP